VVIVQPPQYGTATVTASGQILYTNTANTSAADSFTYTVASPEGTSAPATVSLTFAASPHLANTALNVPAAAPTFGYQAASVFPNLYFNKPLASSARG